MNIHLQSNEIPNVWNILIKFTDLVREPFNSALYCLVFVTILCYSNSTCKDRQ